MESKKESVKLIIKQEMFGVDGDDRGLFNAQSEKVAERIVKLFAIPDVVGRSEQLICPKCKTYPVRKNSHTMVKECIKCGHRWAN